MDWIFLDRYKPNPGQRVWLKIGDDAISATYVDHGNGKPYFYDSKGKTVNSDRWATKSVLF